jgi:hypothetical protein
VKKKPATRQAGVALPPRRPAPVHKDLMRLKPARLTYAAGQQSRRAYKKQLGLCSDCTGRALPDRSRCQKHQEAHIAYSQKSRDRAAKKRGWKLVRVKL